MQAKTQVTQIQTLLLACLAMPLAAAELGPVTQQDTLWSLAKAARGDAPYSMYQVIIALQQKNPRAFIGDNVHHVQDGAVLTIPSAAEIAAIDVDSARQKVEADEQRWRDLQKQQRISRKAAGKPKMGFSAQATLRLIQQAVVNKPALATSPQLAPATAETASSTTAVAPPVRVPMAAPAPKPTTQTAAVRQHWTDRLQSDSTFGLDSRWYAKKGLQQQAQSSLSASLLQEWYWQSIDETDSFTFSPYFRVDQRDPERNLLDIRQAFWLRVGRGWELKLGVDQVFWGVTESQHLVDVINQTDLVDNIDGESKLGQPMLQYNVYGDWGTLQTFLLPYFRERTFAGPEGRLRLPLPLLPNEALYQSDREQRHLDWALRYAKQLDQLDLAWSYFQGTSREPGLVPLGNSGFYAPYYPQMKQMGLEGQWIVDSWIWKLESIYRDYDQSGLAHYYAATAGFEYSMVGVLESNYDLGWLMEFQYDSRGLAATGPGQRDLFLGTRLAWNDEAGTELLFGFAQDLDDRGSRSGMLEASTRYNNNIRLRLDAWFFQTHNPQQPIWWLRRDDYVQLGIDYYF
ncbi:MAG: FimV/HubP family polar landmark protein [Rheinheimera sp.]